MEDQWMVFDEQVFGSDIETEDSFSLTTSNDLSTLYDYSLDDRFLSSDWKDPELNDLLPNVRALKEDILSVAIREINTDECSPSSVAIEQKPDIPVSNAEQNSAQNQNIPQNDGNGGVDDCFDILDFSPLTEEECQQMWDIIAKLKTLDLPLPPGDDNTHEENEETNQMTFKEEQEVIDTEESVEDISPEPQPTVAISSVTSPDNCPIDNKIQIQIKEESIDISEEPTPVPSTSPQNPVANVDTPVRSRKRGRRSLEEVGLTPEQIKRRRLDQNRESQQRKRDRKRLIRRSDTFPSNLSSESKSRVINEAKLTLFLTLLEKLRDRKFDGSHKIHLQFLIDLVKDLPFIQS